MSIPLICPNGHQLSAPDHLLGKQVRCPKCQQTVLVEMPLELDLVEEAQADFSLDDPLADATIDPLANEFDIPVHQPVHQPSQTPGTPATGATGTWQAPTRTIETQPHLFETTRGKLGVVGAGLGSGALLALMLLGVISLFRGGSNGSSNNSGLSNSGSSNSGGSSDSSGSPTIETAKIPDTSNPIVREAVQKLKPVLMGMHNYHDKAHRFPPGSSKQSGLSWRVHILPYIGQEALFNKFKLNEPWDSPANLPLLQEMPDAYRLGNDTNKTRMQVICASNTWYGDVKPPKFSSFTDGIRNTISLVVVGSDRAVDWTCPDDFAFDPDKPIESLGKLDGNIIVCAAGESITGIGSNIAPKDFIALITHQGGEVADVERSVNETLNITSEEFRRGLPALAKAAPANVAKNNTMGSTNSVAGANPIAGVGAKLDLQQKLKLATLGLLAHQQQFNNLSMREAKPVGALSWRVHILPYMGHYDLYRQFDFTEAWDGPNNSKLLSKIPACYDTGNGNKTRIEGFADLLGYRGICSMRSITDKSEETILILTVPSAQAIEWTKPDTLGMKSNDVSDLVGAMGKESLDVALCNGTLIRMNADQARKHLTPLSTPNGGEKVEPGELANSEIKVELDASLTTGVTADLVVDMERAKRMKDVILAMQNYQAARKTYPPAQNSPTISKSDGKEQLSWRVLLLPYLDQATLYQQFKLDEPWDSPNNKPLIDQMPTIFGDPQFKSNTSSCIVRITGPGTMFSNTVGPKHHEIQDGGLTVAIMHIKPDPDQPWTKPGDMIVDVKKPSNLKELPEYRFIFGMLDGRISQIKSTLPSEQLSALLTASGGETLPPWMSIYGGRY